MVLTDDLTVVNAPIAILVTEDQPGVAQIVPEHILIAIRTAGEESPAFFMINRFYLVVLVLDACQIVPCQRDAASGDDRLAVLDAQAVVEQLDAVVVGKAETGGQLQVVVGHPQGDVHRRDAAAVQAGYETVVAQLLADVMTIKQRPVRLNSK